MLNNVPVPGQSLGSSRDLINANFATIDTAFSVNHSPYNDGSGNQGMHAFIQMPAATPVLTTPAGIVGLYAKNGPISGVPELFFQRQNQAANTGYSITETTGTTNGWTRLPSGILIKWNSSVSIAGAATTTISVNTVGPDFVAVYTVLISSINSALDYDHVISVQSFTAANFVVGTNASLGVPSATSSISYLAIGI